MKPCNMTSTYSSHLRTYDRLRVRFKSFENYLRSYHYIVGWWFQRPTVKGHITRCPSLHKWRTQMSSHISSRFLVQPHINARSGVIQNIAINVLNDSQKRLILLHHHHSSLSRRAACGDGALSLLLHLHRLRGLPVLRVLLRWRRLVHREALL